jgi:predicted O-methyltransferase YrrM
VRDEDLRCRIAARAAIPRIADDVDDMARRGSALVVEDVIIAGSVSDEDAKKAYPQGWRAPRPYLRFVPQPGV